jgi:hypothetical protein
MLGFEILSFPDSQSGKRFLRAKGVVILHMGHHLTSHQTDLKSGDVSRFMFGPHVTNKKTKPRNSPRMTYIWFYVYYHWHIC